MHWETTAKGKGKGRKCSNHRVENICKYIYSAKFNSQNV